MPGGWTAAKPESSRGHVKKDCEDWLRSKRVRSVGTVPVIQAPNPECLVDLVTHVAPITDAEFILDNTPYEPPAHGETPWWAELEYRPIGSLYSKTPWLSAMLINPERRWVWYNHGGTPGRILVNSQELADKHVAYREVLAKHREDHSWIGTIKVVDDSYANPT